MGSSSEADLFSVSSEHYVVSSEHYESGSEHYELDSEHYAKLLAIADPVREKGRADKHLMEKVILELCAD